jgi:hypothetical protein
MGLCTSECHKPIFYIFSHKKVLIFQHVQSTIIMGSMSLNLKKAINGWQYNGTNQFCNMKITSVSSVKQITSAGNKAPKTQLPTENVFNNNAASDSCPQSYNDIETNEEKYFREFISNRLPQYKASPLLLEKIRSTIHNERLKSSTENI